MATRDEERAHGVDATTRILWLAGGLVAPLGAVALASVAGALEGDYSPVEDHLSGLASVAASTRWLMTSAFVLLGIGVVAIGAGLRRETGWSTASAVILAAGFCTLAVGAFPRSCVEVSCADPAWHHRLHDGFSLPAYGALILAPVLIATRPELGLRPRPAVAASAVTAVLAVAFAVALLPSWNGLVQRALVVSPLAWLAASAVERVVEPSPAGPRAGPVRPLRTLSGWRRTTT